MFVNHYEEIVERFYRGLIWKAIKGRTNNPGALNEGLENFASSLRFWNFPREKVYEKVDSLITDAFRKKTEVLFKDLESIVEIPTKEDIEKIETQLKVLNDLGIMRRRVASFCGLGKSTIEKTMFSTISGQMAISKLCAACIRIDELARRKEIKTITRDTRFIALNLRDLGRYTGEANVEVLGMIAYLNSIDPIPGKIGVEAKFMEMGGKKYLSEVLLNRRRYPYPPIAQAQDIINLDSVPFGGEVIMANRYGRPYTMKDAAAEARSFAARIQEAVVLLLAQEFGESSPFSELVKGVPVKLFASAENSGAKPPALC